MPPYQFKPSAKDETGALDVNPKHVRCNMVHVGQVLEGRNKTVYLIGHSRQTQDEGA